MFPVNAGKRKQNALMERLTRGVLVCGQSTTTR
jgi:hypothetical protein